MSGKERIEQLRANVKARESKLEEEIKMLSVSKKKDQSRMTTKMSMPSSGQKTSQASEWDALERVIGLMDDLLISYRKYSLELEKKITRFDAKAESSKRSK